MHIMVRLLAVILIMSITQTKTGRAIWGVHPKGIQVFSLTQHCQPGTRALDKKEHFNSWTMAGIFSILVYQIHRLMIAGETTTLSLRILHTQVS
jgi:hypothetical protein